ncbi:MAG: tripeptide aminopeptidase [Bacteroidota bacterium]|nr:tripeptide aminopeptidase [Bacteroidota bacterium]
MKKSALERFIRYVKIDTQSKEDSDEFPSTSKQFNLAQLLADELHLLGLDNAKIDKNCYVTATLHSNIPSTDKAYGKTPAIGFIAHVDTSPEVSGAEVKPQIIENYQGGDITLPGDPSVVIRTSECKKLENCIGHTIITTDGTTLLGADNKSGVAAIMTAVEELFNHPEILHGDLLICFTPDEEVGNGTKFFPMSEYKADFAFTVDGELPGELNKETFSANSAIITVTGRDIHPGAAKNIMVNSIKAAADIIIRLPKNMTPETTEGYEPYIHPMTFEGSVGKTIIKFLLRDFVTAGLEDQKKILQDIIDEVQPMHPKTGIKLEIKEMYRNMREKLEQKPEVLEYLWDAAQMSGTEPYWEPIRGGTDGSRLTEMGLPTPNIYTGGQNFHSKTEWLSLDGMLKAVETIINIAKIAVEKSSK